MDNSVTLRPLTKAGEAFVKEYIHPPTNTGMVEGIPDHSTMSSVVTDFRNEFQIDPPTGVGTGTWSTLLISFPNPQIPLIAIRWVGALPPAVLPAGDIVVFQNPSFTFGTNASTWDTTVSNYRYTKKSLTSHMVVSSLYDQGTAYAAQMAFESFIDPNTQNAGDRLTWSRNLDYIPTAPSQILQASSKSFEGEAKFGSFLVHRYVNPAMQYLGARATYERLVFKYINITGGTSSVTMDLVSGIPIPTPAIAAPTTYDGLTVGYNLYNSLLAQATIRAKCIHSIEATTDLTSAWSVFTEPGPCPDGPAMDLASVEMYKLADGLPAAANDFGAFWNAAKSLGPVLKSVYQGAKPLIKTGLNTLPAGGLLNQILEGVEGLAMQDTSKKGKARANPPPKKKGSTPMMQSSKKPNVKATKMTKAQKKKMKAAYSRMESLD